MEDYEGNSKIHRRFETPHILQWKKYYMFFTVATGPETYKTATVIVPITFTEAFTSVIRRQN